MPLGFAHSYALRSGGQVPVPLYSEALNTNLMELCANPSGSIQREQSQNDGTSQENSSQNVASQTTSSEDSLNANQTQNESNRQNINHGSTQSQDESSQTDGANTADSGHSDANLNAIETELQGLRVENSQHIENIKILMQELSTRNEMIQQMNEKFSSQAAKLGMERQQRAIPKLPNSPRVSYTLTTDHLAKFCMASFFAKAPSR